MIIHRLIVGQTQSGKSTLAKAMAHEAFNDGFLIALHDPIGDDWGITPDYYGSGSRFFDGLEHWAAKQKGQPIVAFIDEAGECLGVGDKNHHWILTRGRHLLISNVIITQRPVLVAPTVRTQCAEIMAFHVSKNDAKLIADDHGEELLEAPELLQGEYLYARWVDGQKVVDKFSAFDKKGVDTPSIRA